MRIIEFIGCKGTKFFFRSYSSTSLQSCVLKMVFSKPQKRFLATLSFGEGLGVRSRSFRARKKSTLAQKDFHYGLG